VGLGVGVGVGVTDWDCEEDGEGVRVAVAVVVGQFCCSSTSSSPMGPSACAPANPRKATHAIVS
jgi:hypothetical protein